MNLLSLVGPFVFVVFHSLFGYKVVGFSCSFTCVSIIIIIILCCYLFFHSSILENLEFPPLWPKEFLFFSRIFIECVAIQNNFLSIMVIEESLAFKIPSIFSYCPLFFCCKFLYFLLIFGTCGFLQIFFFLIFVSLNFILLEKNSGFMISLPPSLCFGQI